MIQSIDNRPTAKQWLQRAYNIDRQIKSKQEMIQMWRGLAERITPTYQDTAIQSSGVSRTEKYLQLIADAEAEVEQNLNTLIIIKKEIGSIIQLISNSNYKVLLEQRYILCKKWEDIADFMDYSTENIFKMHGDALNVVGKIKQSLQ
jgi:hypothetical protein